MLSVKGLTRPGLESIDFELAAGQCIAVTGPSGAGKTIFLRAIADLDPADGAVVLDGTDREDMAACDWRRQVTYVPAEAGWWADAVKEHFVDWRAASALAERLLLPASCGDWPVARLSTGEKQRLALVRALVQAPCVLLLDEPTSGLDPDAIDAVEGVLQERLAAGAAMLVVTHDAAQAARLAGSRLRFDNGRVAA